jgi:uncharacterized NAD-dependent epimerase/dehydratase family protein
MQIHSSDRVVILLHDGIHGVQGKTGLTMLRYSQAQIVAVIDRTTAGQSLPALTGIPRDVPIVADLAAALPYQPTILAIGLAVLGGVLPEDWAADVRGAAAAGLSIVNGLHTRLNADSTLQAALKPGRWIWDVRQEPPDLPVGTGQAASLSCRRVLTVGTDMAIGKMTTSLELHRLGQDRGLCSHFIGTGQAGVMISGDGIPLDAIRVDFAAGAVEQQVMRHGPTADILHIEGQGSFCHPASTATLPLLRGSQPTHLILVHRAGQTHIRRHPTVAIPPLPTMIALYEAVASMAGAFGQPKVVAIALNTAQLSESDANAAIAHTATTTGLPCTDPIRTGAAPLLAAILA